MARASGRQGGARRLPRSKPRRRRSMPNCRMSARSRSLACSAIAISAFRQLARRSSAAGRLARQFCRPGAGLRRDQNAGVIRGARRINGARVRFAAVQSRRACGCRRDWCAASCRRRRLMPGRCSPRERGVKVVVKHENHTPTGSFKARGGLVYVDALLRAGREAQRTGHRDARQSRPIGGARRRAPWHSCR